MCRLLLITCACLAILFGVGGLYMMPKMIQQKIEQRMQLKIGTKTYERFTRIPIPITVKFYLFNVTNSQEVLAGLERPQFQEVGPFVYKQWRRRDVIDIIDNNRKIVYHEYKTFYSEWANLVPASEQHRASWQLNDASNTTILNPVAHQVTMINLPLLSVLTRLAQIEGGLKRRIVAAITRRLVTESGEKILVSKHANEFLFDGYKVDLMIALEDLVSNHLGFNFDSPLPRNKFGFFHGKNGTWKRDEAGELTVFTGRNESMKDFMLVDNWNGLRQLKVWPTNTDAGNRCNEIKGTDGSQFHPGVTREQTLDIFSPLICSSISVKYTEDTSTRDIPLLRFTTPSDVFAAPRKNARNACYCTIPPSGGQHATNNHHLNHQPISARHQKPAQRTGDSAQSGSGQSTQPRSRAHRITDSRCYIDGLMDLSLCQKGAPIAASGPHFYNADPMLAMATNMKPQKHLHETYLDIEPTTGAVFRAASRAQLNALVEEAALGVLETAPIGNMTAMVAPLLWLEEAAEIDEKSSLEFKSQLLNTVNKARRSFFYSIAVGCVLILVVAIQYWFVTCYRIDVSPKETLRRQRRREARAGASRGTRRSDNLARQPLVRGLEGDKQRGATDALAAASALVGAAVVMGAADAAVTANQGRRDRDRRRTRRADYEDEQDLDDININDNNDDDDDDEKLSKRGLVTNEWTIGGAINEATVDSSPVASTSDDYPGEDGGGSLQQQPPPSD